VRTISETEVRSLKGATDGAYQLAGGISQILPFTRVSTSQLSKYASFGDDNRESLVPIDVAIEADRRAKSPSIVKAMAELLGYELVEIVAHDASAQSPITEMDAHRVMSDAMDLSKAILDALTDKRIDALERKRIATEAREAVRAIEQVLTRLEDAP
jgi:hypothetical protein